MKRKAISACVTLLACLVLASCGTGGQTQSSQIDYKSMKDMVLDIMQTDEAKQAVEKMMQDESFQQHIMLDKETVHTTLIQSMTNPNSTHIKEAFQDPKFASTLAKSLQKEQKTLMKDLMKDPEFQKQLVGVLKDPEFERNMLELMKSQAYRRQTMQVMKESLQSPFFQEEMVKLMTKASEEMAKPKTLQSQGGGGGGGESSEGGEGGGGMGGGGGGS
ncbi:spore germination lipoprotein GerD [Brevibacillus sp. TJ4]|uniref:spore germination lipoprotein GerD n=1 Tax=Brevibacillus sp. TJ4 TaxID=3234853 RepID=UPI0037CEE89D